jgi:hypothetical protein
MSIVVRLSPTNVTRENYDEVASRLESAGVWPNPDGLEFHVLFGSEGTLRVSEIWDSREQFEAYGKQLSVMPVLADIPFDSGGPPEIFEVRRLRKRGERQAG